MNPAPRINPADRDRALRLRRQVTLSLAAGSTLAVGIFSLVASTHQYGTTPVAVAAASTATPAISASGTATPAPVVNATAATAAPTAVPTAAPLRPPATTVSRAAAAPAPAPQVVSGGS